MALACRWRSRPQHQKRTRAPQQKGLLFDHLVGRGEQRLRNGQAEGLCGLEIDDQFILGGRLHREIARLLALENAIDIAGRAPELVGKIRSVRDQATIRGAEAVVGDGRQLIAGDEFKIRSR